MLDFNQNFLKVSRSWQTNLILAIPIDIHIVHLMDIHFMSFLLGIFAVPDGHIIRGSLWSKLSGHFSLLNFGFPTLFGFAPVEFSAFSCPMFGSWLG
jgi:hypothetical protein